MTNSLIVACPACHRKNRVPRERMNGDGHCGVCKSLLFTRHPIPVNGDGFQAHVSADLPVIVDFWAPWCGPCRQFAPIFESAAEKLEPRVQLLKVDTEAHSDIAQRFNIRSIPTLAIFYQSKELTRISGALPLAQFLQWVEQALKPL